jgi:hypothetical protein
MRTATVAVEQSLKVEAAIEQAWPLLASASAWSLLPGNYAFDVTVAKGRLRTLITSRGSNVRCAVFEVDEDTASQKVTLRNIIVGRAFGSRMAGHKRSGNELSAEF